MSSHSLVIQTIDLQPNPLPYGELRMRKGAWDQLQASKAYHETVHDQDGPLEHRAALDLKI